MTADELLEKKEWQQLTPLEKKQIAELAADEQEFIMLKKIIALQQDESDVPQVNPAIVERLQAAIQQPVADKSFRKWYYAAAIIAGLLLSTFFILQQPERAKYAIAKTDTAKAAPRQTVVMPYTSPQPDTLQQLVQHQPVVKRKRTPAINNRKEPVFIGKKIQMNASVKDNENLLVFVTEVY